jgi:lipopolysaccharide heptosyltransferase II
MKILVRATNWIGDAVMSIPALETIRRFQPGAEIVVLARPAVADLYREQGFADRFIVYDHCGEHRGLVGRERLAAELRGESFQVAVLLQNAFDAAWLAWRASIPERIGYDRDGRGWLLTRRVAVPRNGEIPAHEAYSYLELLRRAGWLEGLPAVRCIELRISEQAREAARQRLAAEGARMGAPWIAFAPGASYGPAKCWPAERYAALGDRLFGAFGAHVILFGAPQEEEIAAQIARAMRHAPLNLAGTTSMADLPALLGACRLFIGNDSGAMHVAGAVGLPVVGIFGPTDARGTGPVTERRTVVQQQVSCSPCFLRQCPVDHRCMTRISVEEVFAAACAHLEGGGTAESAEPGRKSIG